MSLINDQQRTRSGQTKPTIKPLPSVQPAQAADQLEQIQAPSPAAPEATGESLLPETQSIGEPGTTGLFPDAATDAMIPTPPVDNALEDALNLTPPMQDGVGVGTRIPTPEEILQNVGRAQMPRVLQDVGQQYGDDKLYAPDIIVTKVPTVYNTIDPKSTLDLVKQGYAGISDTAGRRDAEQRAAAQQTQQIIEDRNRLLNVPRVDKPWNASPAANNNNPFSDILFGNEQHRRDQPFKPQQGSYGKQGAGLLGGINYLLNLPLNASVAVAGEINEATANIFKTFGVSEKDAQNYARNGLLGLLPEKLRPSSLLGFDWKKAQSRNLIQDALTGDPVGDTNDPKGTNKGVFYSPRRSQNVRSRQIADPKNPLSQVDQAYNDVIAVAQNDPIGTAIEVGIQLFNPGDAIIDKVWNTAWRSLGKKTAGEVGQRSVRQTPKPKPAQNLLPPSGAKPKPSTPSPSNIRVQNGSATWRAPGEVTALPKKPDVVQAQVVNATAPQKSPRVLTGSPEVVQKALPPAIDPASIKGINVQELLNTPSGTALKVGIGKPSAEPLLLPPGLTLRGVDDIPGGTKAAPTFDLLDAAEELAAHKAVLAQPLNQLDDLFETSVDFGRRTIQEVPFEKLTPEAVERIFDTGARLNIPEQALQRIDDLSPEIGMLLRESDYDGLADFVGSAGMPRYAVSDIISEVNNLELSEIAIVKANPTARFTTKAPDVIHHGTALKNWTPIYNTRLNGSRGELGSGLYLVDKPEVAQSYAGAVMGENAPVGALELDIDPAVYSLKQKFESTLDARAKIPSNDLFVRQVIDGLDDELQSNVMRSVQRDSSTSYVSLWNKIEANLVRSNLEPTENLLRSVNNRVSENLRNLGYDSIYDAKSGFALALDETKLITIDVVPVPRATNPMDAIVNRYNADAYTAKFYPERVTTDANLRDSAAKVLNQTEDAVDTKLREVQQEIIKRGYDKRETVLPDKDSIRAEPPPKQPETFEEAVKEIPARSNNPCQP